MDKSIFEKLRREYLLADFNKKTALADPIDQFCLWLEDAISASFGEPNAMVLATVSAEGQPSQRVVLLKHVDEGGFFFHTNYESRKGRELHVNPSAALLFYWGELHRQVRIEGTIEKISREKSVEYFKTRPFESQVSAWVSAQSSSLENREMLEARHAELVEQYRGQEVPIPAHWGGMCLKPKAFEFWQGREHRLHDRICYTKRDDKWHLERLSP